MRKVVLESALVVGPIEPNVLSDQFVAVLKLSFKDFSVVLYLIPFARPLASPESPFILPISSCQNTVPVEEVVLETSFVF